MFDSPGRSKSPTLRKSTSSKLVDAAGNSVVFSNMGKKLLARKSNTNDTNDKRRSVELSAPPQPCPEAECTNETDSKPGSALIRRPTFKEFEGRLKGKSSGSRLIKSQSLDHEPKGYSVVSPRPPTPGEAKNNVGLSKEKVRGFSSRAREVFMNHSENKVSSEVITNKPASFMSRLFQRS